MLRHQALLAPAAERRGAGVPGIQRNIAAFQRGGGDGGVAGGGAEGRGRWFSAPLYCALYFRHGNGAKERLAVVLDVPGPGLEHGFDSHVRGFDNEQKHVRECAFDPSYPEICVGADFNVDGFSMHIAQSHEYIWDRLRTILTGERLIKTTTFDEITLMATSTQQATEELAQRLIVLARRCNAGRLKIRLTGDSSGNQRKTSSGGSAGPESVWDIVKKTLRRELPSGMFQLSFNIYSTNEAVRTRINRANRLMRSSDGESLIEISPKCKSLVNDLQKVRWARDAHGNTLSILDKRDPKLTHSCDSWSYLLRMTDGSSVGEQPGRMF